MSIVVVATILPLPEHREAVVEAFVQAIPKVHTEPGCELYALTEGEDRLVMVEKWSGPEALAAHDKGAALAELGKALAGKLAGKLDVQVLQPHPAGTSELGTV
jgi:quinol monooxygenase YgiN